jgi:hypothetical protein
MTEDYAEIEELVIALQQESQLLRDLLAHAEQATPEVSRQIRDRFVAVQGLCIKAADFLSEDADVEG